MHTRSQPRNSRSNSPNEGLWFRWIWQNWRKTWKPQARPGLRVAYQNGRSRSNSADEPLSGGQNRGTIAAVFAVKKETHDFRHEAGKDDQFPQSSQARDHFLGGCFLRLLAHPQLARGGALRFPALLRHLRDADCQPAFLDS